MLSKRPGEIAIEGFSSSAPGPSTSATRSRLHVSLQPCLAGARRELAGAWIPASGQFSLRKGSCWDANCQLRGVAASPDPNLQGPRT